MFEDVVQDDSVEGSARQCLQPIGNFETTRAARRKTSAADVVTDDLPASLAGALQQPPASGAEIE
jgi:hypothetical protein